MIKLVMSPFPAKGERNFLTNGNLLYKCKFPSQKKNLCLVFRAFLVSAGFQWPLAQHNPQFRAILNQKRQSGMSWQDMVSQIARQNNINLTPYIQGLSQRGIKL